MTDEMPTPPRGEVFVSSTAKVVWSAILALEPPDQFEVLIRLQMRLASADVKANSHDLRISGAHAALRRAAEMLEHSPSVEEYRRLRSEHHDAGFPADGTIRRILGGSWNDALASAHLQTVEGGDMIVASLGVAFTREELIAGLRECADDLGSVPSVPQYLGWARKPETRQRANGRRARSIEAYNRVFGSWVKGLIAAGLIDDSDAEVITWHSEGRSRIFRITDEGVAQALREVAEHLGHVPSTVEYPAAREELLQAAMAAGKPRGIPSYQVLYRRYGSWAAALKAAGLQPRTGRGQGKRGEPHRVGPRTSDETCLEFLRRAHRDCGSPFTRDVYERWRKQQRAESGGVLYIPGYTRFLTGWGGWWAACEAAFGGDERANPSADVPEYRKDAKVRGRYKPPPRDDADGGDRVDVPADDEVDAAAHGDDDDKPTAERGVPA